MSSIAPSANGGFLSSDLSLAKRAREGDTRGLAVEAARTLVAEAFVKPVFAQLRDGGFAADGFKPGTGEKRFRPMLDAALADKVVESSNFTLVDRVADRFERSIELKSRQRASAEVRR
jgi:hypothetical protein